jgi:hypothetical protein
LQTIVVSDIHLLVAQEQLPSDAVGVVSLPVPRLKRSPRMVTVPPPEAAALFGRKFEKRVFCPLTRDVLNSKNATSRKLDRIPTPFESRIILRFSKESIEKLVREK